MAIKLQLALDSDLETSLAILRQVQPYIDIAELGTPLIYREGIQAAWKIRDLYPDLLLLADFKIMDAGEDEASIAYEAILGLANDVTVKGAVAAARRFGKQLVVDMMQVSDDLNRARFLLSQGCDYLCVHTAYDLHSQTQQTPLQDLASLRHALPTAPLAVAGGIGLNQIDAVIALNPQIIVIGGAITKSANPAELAKEIRKHLESQ
jgi:3-hexulose-6-phosphate synthase